MASNYYEFKKNPHASYFSTLDSCFEKFKKSFFGLHMTQTEKNEAVKSTTMLLEEIRRSVISGVQKKPNNAMKIVEDSFGHIIRCLSDISNVGKRDKIIKSINSYVEPVELSSGFKHVLLNDKTSCESIQSSVQTTFMLVSPLKKLTILFSSEEYEHVYMNYNKNHVCHDGVYERFCCGSVYKNNLFFRANPLAIQVKLFFDDFEPCDALKSRAGKHKTTGIYMQINNMPPEMASKLSNIHLVALCNSSDAKNEYADTNNVIDVIVKDLQILENVGITTIGGINLKGTLVFNMFDNLGGNILYGLSGSFNANYYCRICVATKAQCQEYANENSDQIRSIDVYNQYLVSTECYDEPSIDWCGIQKYCHLNNLNNFHIMTNQTVDFMHDILEGVASIAIESLFGYIVENKIASINIIQHMIECFNFGDSFKKTAPSQIKITKKNLGQSASQMYCLVLHLPFILFKFKAQILSVWQPIETLLQILQIALSHRITEQNVTRLERLVHDHLHSMKNIFGQHFRPKHHLLTHYGRIIKSMGPMVNYWVMRMEAKHQFFKQIAKTTKNFTNLKKTMANKHEEKACMGNLSLQHNLILSKVSYPLVQCNDYDEIEAVLTDSLEEATIQNLSIVKSIQKNDMKFKPGYLIPMNSEFYQIHYILMHDDKVWFLCNCVFQKHTFDTYLNSFLLKKSEKYNIIVMNDSIISYEKKTLNGNAFLIASNLDLID